MYSEILEMHDITEDTFPQIPPHRNFHILAIAEGNRIIAKTIIAFEGDHTSPSQVYLTAFGVNKDYRHKGYGTMLMNAIKTRYDKNISLGVEPDNEIAIKFYKSCDFELEQEGLYDSEWDIKYNLFIWKQPAKCSSN